VPGGKNLGKKLGLTQRPSKSQQQALQNYLIAKAGGGLFI